MLCNLEKKVSPLCSFCMEESESPIHLVHFCTITKFLWMQLWHSFQNVLIIPPITPHSAIFGSTNYKVNYHLINLILLIFKCYVYKTRENGSLDLKFLKRNFHKIKILRNE